ncbi:hypothetical protein NM688_g6437 [Phlebia brevispora]|uniref:Uncharacterized protein n=1 Tax=Phlebia brevispora TaxID=194682 RepID=A0ACC1SFW9_9APHY|nr:hypothetical protein NM688_g6437 [Phlebia brevispora]
MSAAVTRFLSSLTHTFQRILFHAHERELERRAWPSDFPEHIFVDIIFPLLDLDDIKQLRQVSKWFYDVVRRNWQRHLRSVRRPLYLSSPNLCIPISDPLEQDAGRHIFASSTLDLVWRRPVPSCSRRWYFNARYQVKHMVLVPGSQYLVVSVCHPNSSDHAIVLYHLDGPLGASAIAKYSVPTEAYHLQAKYVNCDARAGLAIAFVCRRERRVNRGVREDEKDGGRRTVYECRALHVSTDDIESLCDPSLVPGSQAFIKRAQVTASPFAELAYARSSRPLGPLSLDELEGRTYLSWVHADGDNVNKITLKPLFYSKVDDTARPSATTLILGSDKEYPDAHYRIRAFRLLLQQMDVLVVREVRQPQQESRQPVLTTIELHPVVLSGTRYTSNCAPDNRVAVKDGHYDDIQITESAQSFPPTSSLPGPISIWFTVVDPEPGLMQYVLFPDPPRETEQSGAGTRPQAAPSYAYRLRHLRSTPSWVPAPRDTHLRAIPGSVYTLLYSVSKSAEGKEGSLERIYRYLDPNLLRSRTDERKSDDEAEEADVESILDDDPSSPVLSSMCPLPYEVDSSVGSSPFAWDESVGRLCFAAGQDCSRIRVWDFSKTPSGCMMHKSAFAGVPVMACNELSP